MPDRVNIDGSVAQVDVEEANLEPALIEESDKACVTGTTRCVFPAVSCADDGTVGTGRPGPVAMRLDQACRAAFDNLIDQI